MANAFLDGLIAGQRTFERREEDAYRRKLRERGEQDWQRQESARTALGRAVQGDQSALPDLAAADPSTYMQYQATQSQQQRERLEDQRKAAEEADRALGVIFALPPQARPAAWTEQRARLASLGYDVSTVPPQYNEGTAQAYALRNKSMLEWLQKRSENEVTTSPGGGSSLFGGSAGPSAGNVQPLNVPKDAGSYFGGAIDFHAQKYKLPDGLLARVIAQESNFKPDAVGPETKYGRAQGLTQIMPGTAQELGVDPRNPVQAIEGGARYLRQNLDKYGGDETLALMAYNWGPGNVDRWIAGGRDPNRVPAETRNYVARIQGAGQPQGGAPQPAADQPSARPLFRGGAPFTEGLPAGYQWGQDQQGNRVQMRIPGTRPNLKQVALADGVWNIDDQGQKVSRLGDRPDRNEGEGREFTQEEKLRNTYMKQTQDFTALRQHFTRMQAAVSQPDGAGDIALVYSFMKMLDPASVVREGEFATAAEAGGVPDRVLTLYNKVVRGERLPPAVRQSFVEQGSRQFDQAYGQYEAARKVYTDLAGAYGLDPSRVVLDMTGGVGRPNMAGPQPQQPNPAQAAPRAINPQTGETLILRDGQWVPEAPRGPISPPLR